MRFLKRSIALTFTILAFSIFCSGQVFPAPDGEFYTEYDRFKDQTTSWLMQMQVAEKKYDFDYQRIYVSVFVQFPSTKPTKKPDQIGIMFTSWSLFNDRFTTPPALDAIIDGGQRKAYGYMTPVSRRVINGKYVVSLATVMSAD